MANLSYPRYVLFIFSDRFLSEPLIPSALGPFFPNVHFAMGETESLVDRVPHYLDHSAERLSLVEQVYDFATNHMTMEIMVGELLAKLDSRSVS